MAAEEPRIWSPGPSGKAEQASDPEASAPDPYAQASHDLNCRHDLTVEQTEYRRRPRLVRVVGRYFGATKG